MTNIEFPATPSIIYIENSIISTMQVSSISVRSLHARLYQYTCRQRTKICNSDSIRPSISASHSCDTRQFQSSTTPLARRQNRAHLFRSSRRPIQDATEALAYDQRCRRCRAFYTQSRKAAPVEPNSTAKSSGQDEVSAMCSQ